jgi:hypothetical protein
MGSVANKPLNTSSRVTCDRTLVFCRKSSCLRGLLRETLELILHIEFYGLLLQGSGHKAVKDL